MYKYKYSKLNSEQLYIREYTAIYVYIYKYCKLNSEQLYIREYTVIYIYIYVQQT